jgi:hypothetical protein
MAFNIHQLDNIDSYSDIAEKELEKYQSYLIKRFHNSPEGERCLQAIPDMGFFAAQLIYYGFSYIGVTLPNMNIADVDEIITELFPRKITLNSPDKANDIIPELIAFWHFLKREYKLQNAESMLKYLESITSGYKDIMNDSSKYGMAKSFMMAGKSAGFDMTDESDLQKFAKIYNEDISPQTQIPSGEYTPPSSIHGSRKSKSKKKKLRKIAKSSRKKNRKRK